jgi:hypothetical protein
MSGTAADMWRSRRERLDAVIDRARDRAAAEGMQLFAQVDPGEEPSPAASWHWHLTCTAGDVEVEVIASPDLASFAIEDGGGRFEIEAGAAEFPEVLVATMIERRRSLRSSPRAGE